MVPFICPQNVDSASFDIVAPISNNLHKKLPILLYSTLYMLDPLLLNYKITDEEPAGTFL